MNEWKSKVVLKKEAHSSITSIVPASGALNAAAMAAPAPIAT
jgi:hypothetical protein